MPRGGVKKKRAIRHVMLAPDDDAAIAFIGKVHGHGTQSDSVRFAMNQQRARAVSGKHWAFEEALREQVLSMERTAGLDRHRKGLPKQASILRKFGIWVDMQDEDAMAVIRDAYDLESKSAAVRFAVRCQARFDRGGIGDES